MSKRAAGKARLGSPSIFRQAKTTGCRQQFGELRLGVVTLGGDRLITVVTAQLVGVRRSLFTAITGPYELSL
jgi:hypothetical protein